MRSSPTGRLNCSEPQLQNLAPPKANNDSQRIIAAFRKPVETAPSQALPENGHEWIKF